MPAAARVSAAEARQIRVPDSADSPQASRAQTTEHISESTEHEAQRVRRSRREGKSDFGSSARPGSMRRGPEHCSAKRSGRLSESVLCERTRRSRVGSGIVHSCGGSSARPEPGAGATAAAGCRTGLQCSAAIRDWTRPTGLHRAQRRVELRSAGEAGRTPAATHVLAGGGPPDSCACTCATLRKRREYRAHNNVAQYGGLRVVCFGPRERR